MPPALVFDRSLDAAYGVAVDLSPRIARLLAPNPGPFTFRGTGVYLAGGGDSVMVIDPGPDLPDHLAALKRALAGRRVSHILVTHPHADHSPAARPLAEWSGAKIYGCPLRAAGTSPAVAQGAYGGGGPEMVEEGFDSAFTPDVTVRDGDVIARDGVTLDCVFTPGHTAGHMCYALREEKALFSGDHVMGWSTSVIAPPDGDMAHYMASLEKLVARDDAIFYPTHGSPIAAPRPYLRALLAHRRAREAQILAALPAAIPELAARLYADIDPRLRPAAARTIAAHLVKLVTEGRAAEKGGHYEAV